MGMTHCQNFCTKNEREFNPSNSTIFPTNTDSLDNDYTNTNLHFIPQQINTIENSIPDNKTFNKILLEKLPYLGKKITQNEFEILIPEDIYKYIKNNPLDISNLQITNKKLYFLNPIKFFNGNIYHGNWNNNIQMEGYGIYYLKNEKIIVEGIWNKGNLIYGNIFLPNGDFYQGEIKNSKFHGKGKYIYINGDKYKGNFLNGVKNGDGFFEYNNGTFYQGEFSNDKFNGKGVMKWKDGTEYKGNFVNSMLNGKGVILNLIGEKYEGNFNMNKFHGKGKLIYSDGGIYSGEFEMGEKNGRGKFKRNDICYEGEWRDDKPHGIGIINKNGKKYKSIWRYGNLVEISCISGEEINNVDIKNDIEIKICKCILCSKTLANLDYYLNNDNEINTIEASFLPSFLDE